VTALAVELSRTQLEELRPALAALPAIAEELATLNQRLERLRLVFEQIPVE
jgi:hypothetical protein